MNDRQRDERGDTLTCDAIVLLGPSEDDQKRLYDLLDSVARYEPLVSRIVLVDDSPCQPPVRLALDLPFNVERIPNPRQAHGCNLTGGLCAGMLAGLKHIGSSLRLECEFVLKLDTDALVIAPFASKLGKLFRDNPSVGAAGAYRFTPNREPRDFSFWSPIVSDLGRNILLNHKRLRRAGRRWPMALSGQAALRRSWVRRALARDYQPGENVLGGSYALSAAALRSWQTAGALDDPLLWLDTELGEDVLISLLVKAIGMNLAGFCWDQEAFGVRYQGLPDSPHRLLERGFSIIHSVKNDPRATEDEIRAFFARCRGSTVATLSERSVSEP